MHTIFVQKATVHPFSDFLQRFDKCHKTSRIFPRTEQTSASARSFWCLSFVLEGRGLFERPRAPSQNQKGHFYEKMNVLNDTKTSELSKSAKETGNICDCLWHLSRGG